MKDPLTHSAAARCTTAPIAIVSMLLIASCSGAPGATRMGGFISRSVSRAAGSLSSTRSFGTATAADLGTTYGDVNRASLQFAATADISQAPTLATRGAGDYIMALSQYDLAYTTPPTNQSVLATIPSVGTTTISVPASLGGFFYGSPVATSFNSIPKLTQAYGGAGLLTFLGATLYDGTVDSDLYAWVRGAGSDTWTGSGGGTAAPATLTTATTQVDNRAPGICDVATATDYSGGFLVGWCSEDDATNSFGNLISYSSFFGWGSATQIFLAGFDVSGAVDATKFAGTAVSTAIASPAGAAPAVGGGMDVAYFKDSSQRAWVAQVVASTPGAAPADYNVRMGLWNGVLNRFLAADGTEFIDEELSSADFAGTEVVWNPRIFVDSSSYVTVFFAHAAAAGVSTTGDLYMYTANVTDVDSDGDLDTLTPVNAAPFYTDLDDIAFDPAEAGEPFSYVMAVSPSGTKAALLFARDSSTLVVRVRDSAGSWPVSTTYSAPAAGLTIKHMALSIDDSGNMLAGFSFETALGCAYPVGARYSLTEGWTSTLSSLLTTASPSVSACDPDYIRMSTTLDNNNKGILGFTCAPMTAACVATGGITRQYLVPYQ